MKVEIEASTAKKIQDLMAMQQLHDAPNAQTTMKGFVNYLLETVIEGYERPGSWEREIVEVWA